MPFDVRCSKFEDVEEAASAGRKLYYFNSTRAKQGSRWRRRKHGGHSHLIKKNQIEKMIYIALKSSHVAVLAALVLFLSLSTPSPTSATTSKPPPPHIVYILADDFGWRYADWHRKDLVNQSITPTLQKLVDQGVELDRLYAFKFCSPSREWPRDLHQSPFNIAKLLRYERTLPENYRLRDPNWAQPNLCQRPKRQTRGLKPWRRCWWLAGNSYRNDRLGHAVEGERQLCEFVGKRGV